MPLDHADPDRQQHGGNDGCGEDKAVLKRKQEPVGQHDRADQYAAELWYTFKTIHRCWRPMQGIDYHLADAMNDYWCNFARTGDPNGKGLPHWTPYSSANRAGMELGERIGMLDDPGVARTHFLRDYIMGRI